MKVKDIYHFIFLFFVSRVECFKCFENQDDPRFKKFIWGANVGYHYKNCPFGCSTEDGKIQILYLSYFFSIETGKEFNKKYNFGEC